MLFFKKKSYDDQVKELEAKRKKIGDKLQKETKIAKLKTDIQNISTARKHAIQKQHPYSAKIYKGAMKGGGKLLGLMDAIAAAQMKPKAMPKPKKKRSTQKMAYYPMPPQQGYPMAPPMQAYPQPKPKPKPKDPMDIFWRL